MDDDYSVLTDSDSAERRKRIKFQRRKKCRLIIGLLIICVLGLLFLTLLRYSWFTMPLHASCKVKFSWPDTKCVDLNEIITEQIRNWTGRDNCLNGGQKCLYNLLENTQEFIRATHTTPVKAYVDTLSFSFKQNNSTCVIDGFSSSNLWYAVLDYGTNYCNLKNLLIGSRLDQANGYLEETCNNICTQYTSADCSIY